ncbi:MULTISPECIES: hypothetical protein [Pseudomonas]|uniref:Uncharacterized protein n=1 Tax=Pseudomonas aphyarum TaxID=2942629 RepID=A0ABT5PLW0_9PSED|nr:hypothetical protein [Pseudomonas aphyarum]MDD0968587.1 hypothetical protein [Pseudomonas aphyarum]MDD1124487.1 hypothetical protein [Pseudomonas aphyarum]
MSLNKDWQPGYGEIITWFAMDKNGLIAVMVNNCFGRLPSVLLDVLGLEAQLDRINEFMWEESSDFFDYPESKAGRTLLDMYSFRRYRNAHSRKDVQLIVSERSGSDKKLSEYSIPSIKGFYIYHAVESSVPGEDYPVGCKEDTVAGDYFRFLVPTVHAGVEDFPEELRSLVVVSDTLDFTSDKIIASGSIDLVF